MNIITKTSATAAAIVSLGTLAWAFGDNTGYRPWLKKEQNEFTQKQFQIVMDQTQQNTLAISKNKFDLLYAKQVFGELTFDEKVSLCKDAQILGYVVTDKDGGLMCTKEGEPIITFRSNSQ